MSNITGEVQEIQSLQRNTKYGPKPTFKLIIDNIPYNLGFNNPSKQGIREGTEVTFQSVHTAYGEDIDMPTLRVVGGGSTVPTPAARPAASAPAAPAKAPHVPPAAKVFPVPLFHGDRSIIRQNSLTNAREVYCSSTVVVSSSNTDELADQIIHLARKFEAYSAGDLDRAQAEEEMNAAKVPAKKAKAAPKLDTDVDVSEAY